MTAKICLLKKAALKTGFGRHTEQPKTGLDAATITTLPDARKQAGNDRLHLGVHFSTRKADSVHI